MQPNIEQSYQEAKKRYAAHGIDVDQALGQTCVTNVWVPDGYKDIPADRMAPRERLKASLDEVFAEELNPAFNLDAVESKLFGLGAEAYTVGSHEFLYGLWD